MDKPDKRTIRGAVRRAAYSDAVAVLRLADLKLPPVATSDDLASLYFNERNRLLEWLEDRAKGVLAVPPGGVQVKRKA